jgi:hypothetical protein
MTPNGYRISRDDAEEPLRLALDLIHPVPLHLQPWTVEHPHQWRLISNSPSNYHHEEGEREREREREREEVVVCCTWPQIRYLDPTRFELNVPRKFLSEVQKMPSRFCATTNSDLPLLLRYRATASFLSCRPCPSCAAAAAAD